MNDHKLKSTVTEAVALDREIAEKTERLKELKSDLVTEAALRPEDHTETTGGGSSCIFEGNDGCVARVTFPAKKLKSSIPGEGAAITKIRESAGKFFSHLFQQTPAYKPVAHFRETASSYLGKDAKKLIKLCESNSAPAVAFETKEPA
jgi:hypothetical protein